MQVSDLAFIARPCVERGNICRKALLKDGETKVGTEADMGIRGWQSLFLRRLVCPLKAGTATLLQRPMLLTASHKGLHICASDELSQYTVSVTKERPVRAFDHPETEEPVSTGHVPAW